MHEKTLSTLQQLRSQYDALVLDAKALADQSSGSLLPRYTNQHPIFDLPLITNLPQLEQQSPKRRKGKERQGVVVVWDEGSHPAGASRGSVSAVSGATAAV
jgi:hypothetical protein